VTFGSPVPGRIDVLLGFDLLTSVTAQNVEGLDPSWSHVVASSHITPTGKMIGKVATANLDTSPFRGELDSRSDAGSNLYPNAAELAIGLLGSGVTANTLLLGVAYQAGLIPVSAEAIEQAIELNGAAIEANRSAFRWGRRWVVEPAAVEAAARGAALVPADQTGLDDLSSVGVNGAALVQLVANRRADLRAYQDDKYASRYLEVVRRVARAEKDAGTDGSFTKVVAEQLFRVMAYKDEYEVARLLVSGKDRIEWALGGPVESMSWNLHPPTLRAMGMKKKLVLGPWTKSSMVALAALKKVRGTPADLFGRGEVRKAERQLIEDYIALVDKLCGRLALGSDVGGAAREVDEVVRVAGLVDQVRGFEGVKMRNLEAYRKALAASGL
jgi:indolepyruvate ferredoxin oxidoreductase